jgi:NADH:ubiquinone oxidoreductase subunit 3 (subunit A)
MAEVMITELVIAFVVILATSFSIYFLGRFLSPKPVQSENAQSTYACGEKASFTKLRVNISLYKYLIYFVVLDSSVLLIGFAALTMNTINLLIFMVYLFAVLVSGFLLLGGGDR